MEKRFQVFVSSTFTDLVVERQEVLQALLELDCIPSGMELFPAADEDQWSLIKRVISDCDYYILVSAGRYGSIGPSGKSYTHMEYEYALELGKPIIAFLHKDITSLPAGQVEQDQDGRDKLAEFRTLCQKKLVKFWSEPVELGSVVSRSIVRLQKDRPAVGWVRADALPTEDQDKEMLRLRSVIDDLRSKLDSSKSSIIRDTSDLVQGADEIPVQFSFRTISYEGVGINRQTWNWNGDMPFEDIFTRISPMMLEEAKEGDLRTTLSALFQETFSEACLEQTKAEQVSQFSITDDSYQTIKVQLVALGLIEKGEKKRPIQDRGPYWKLTERGEVAMMQARAIKRVDLLAET